MNVITSNECGLSTFINLFNVEFPVDVIWCGFSILIRWFLWESAFHVWHYSLHKLGLYITSSQILKGQRFSSENSMTLFLYTKSSRFQIFFLIDSESMTWKWNGFRFREKVSPAKTDHVLASYFCTTPVLIPQFKSYWNQPLSQFPGVFHHHLALVLNVSAFTVNSGSWLLFCGWNIQIQFSLLPG